MIGDDARTIMALSADHKLIDSATIFEYPAKRISKEDKTDIESSAFIKRNGEDCLLAISSFSTKKRNKLLFITLEANGKIGKIDSIIQSFDIPDMHGMNIEGATTMDSTLVLVNRANTSTNANYLLLTRLVHDSLVSGNLNHIFILLPQAKITQGISGLEYLPQRDILLFTASTEDTPSAYQDGTIGESYLGCILDFSKKINADVIKPDRYIALSGVLGSKLQKIESIAVEKEKTNELVIHLAADNDNGSSSLFKLRWKL
jgi:hypothetical protein